MLLKAGTYRFNDEISFDSIPPISDEEQQSIYVSDTANYIPIVLDGLNGYIFPHYLSVDGNYRKVVYVTESNSFSWYDLAIYGDENGNVQSNEYFAKDYTITEDVNVNDNIGTWYIANTNYNEVNASDTTYLEKSSWYTSVANAIRSKKGTSEPILRDNFASEIESISVGSTLPYYDGTVIIEKAESEANTEGVSF